jgi:hypothetical protein
MRKMTIDVYWTAFGNEWFRAREPEPINKIFFNKKLHENNNLMNFNKCPFFNESLDNTFALRSLYDYSFKVENLQVFSNLHDQTFFDNRIIIRSIEKKCFSFLQEFIFFTEEETLEISCPEFPYLEDNNITKRCMPFVGKMDIGKYFRNIDFAFFLKDGYEEFVIEENEIFGYIKFLTEKKINFKQFYPSEKIIKYSKISKGTTYGLKSIYRPRSYFYDRFKMKKIILNEIKQNLL